MSRRWIFGTNWKMNKNALEGAEYAAVLKKSLLQLEHADSIQVFVLPPYTSIGAVTQISDGAFWVGAQNMHWEESGPYTGEISATMLTELGVDLVQLGHAERRDMFCETDQIVNQKIHAALRAGLRALVCIGENHADRSFDVARQTCARQLRIALDRVPSAAANRILIGYEPSWAIGENGTTADAGHIREMKDVARSVLTDIFGSDSAECIPILYGGSVSAEEAPELLVSSEVDGLFVGRAALDPAVFAKLIGTCLKERRKPATTP